MASHACGSAFSSNLRPRARPAVNRGLERAQGCPRDHVRWPRFPTVAGRGVLDSCQGWREPIMTVALRALIGRAGVCRVPF